MNDILLGKICPYCNAVPEYVDSKCIYGSSYGMIYLCKPCDAYVGVNPGTDKPLGRLANRELRFYKKQAHKFFDTLWNYKIATGVPKWKARTKAYKWLATEMGKEFKFTHIGMFDIEECKKVVELCRPYFEKVCKKRVGQYAANPSSKA